MSDKFIGLMSGTSLDGIDAIVCEFSPTIQSIATHHHPFDPSLKQDLQRLSLPGDDAIDVLGKAQTELGHVLADAVLALLDKANLSATDIRAIGSHGHTIRHRPGGHHPFTIQIGDPNIIAARTGIATIADFRRADMALGGQGAPLAPAFHRAFFPLPATVLNLGGIANISIVGTETEVGFDTGPANTLLDAWCKQHRGLDYDDQGSWARSGQVCERLLQSLLADPYFKQAPPKSTGKEYFHLDWLAQQLSSQSAEDVQASLLELTAKTIADAFSAQQITGEIIVCGGGAHNVYLLERLQAHLPACTLSMSDDFGIGVDWVEAAGFAWLAQQRVLNQAIQLQTVTGASAPVRLGAIYQA